MLEELTAEVPLVVRPNAAVQIQLAVSEADAAGRRTLALHSRPEGGEAEWIRHASGALVPPSSEPALPRRSSWPPPGAEPLAAEELYDRVADAGFEYGPLFQGLRSAWRHGDKILTEVRLPEELAERREAFAIHPALLDAALHASFFLAAAAEEPRVPFSWSGVALHRTGASLLRVCLRPVGDGISLDATDSSGEPVFSIEGLGLRPLERGVLAGGGEVQPDSLFRLRWREVAIAEPDGEEPPLGAELWRCEPDPGAHTPCAAGATLEQALTRAGRGADAPRAGHSRGGRRGRRRVARSVRRARVGPRTLGPV
jgi:acyl transferase domain-containing protein